MLRGHEAKVVRAAPAGAVVFKRRGVDLVHACVEHGHHLVYTVLVAGVFGHGQQRVHRQHRHTAGTCCGLGTKGQALGHGTRGAQAGERTRAPAKHNGVKVGKPQARLRHAIADGRDQARRRLRAAGPGVGPQLVATRHGDGNNVGTGVEGQQVHTGLFFMPKQAVAHTALAQTAIVLGVTALAAVGEEEHIRGIIRDWSWALLGRPIDSAPCC